MLFLSTGLRPSIVNLRSDVCLFSMSGHQSLCFDHVRPVSFALDPNLSNHMAFNICPGSQRGPRSVWEFQRKSLKRFLCFFEWPEPSSQPKGLELRTDSYHYCVWRGTTQKATQGKGRWDLTIKEGKRVCVTTTKEKYWNLRIVCEPVRRQSR